MPRVFGIETEFGITVDGADSVDVVAESIALVRAYAESIPSPPDVALKWDYQLEDPHLDMRGFRVEELLQDFDEAQYFAQDEARPLSFEEIKSDLVLGNGARFYNDHAHPEYATPECLSLRELVAQDKAGERIVEECVRRRNRSRPDGRVKVYKNNTDFIGHSYGCHDNYLMARRVPFEEVIRGLTPFLVTRQIFAGAGKVGAENGTASPADGYQLSQRADFFSVRVSIDTMNRRPIINTRDEPHADPEKFRRLHVIVGDANMSEFATALKLGTTARVLDLLEQGDCPRDLELADPVEAIRAVSRDLTLRQPLRLADGRTINPIDLQREYLARAEARLRGHGEETDWVLQHWRSVLDDLEADPRRCRDRLDWVAKKWMLDTFVAAENLTWEDPWLPSLDLEYHNVCRESGLFAELQRSSGMRRLVGDEDIARAIQQPPRETRAYFRGICVSKFGHQLAAAQWDELRLAVGGEAVAISLRNVFDEATVRRYNEAIDQAADVATLIRILKLESR